MLARVKHGEDTGFGEVGKAEVPFTLHVFCANLVNLLEGIEVGNAHFCR
jgi:hypothetical protein